MKRLLPAVFLLLMTGSALAFDPTPARERIGVLRASDGDLLARETYVQRSVLDALHKELRERGFDAYDAEATFDQVSRDADRSADFYIEVTGDGDTVDYGGVDIAGRHADVTLGIVVSRVAAELRIYDGRTLELLATESLARRSTAVLPTSVGVGGADLFAYVALPLIERAQVRRVARAAAREMAARVTTAVRGQ